MQLHCISITLCMQGRGATWRYILVGGEYHVLIRDERGPTIRCITENSTETQSPVPLLKMAVVDMQ